MSFELSSTITSLQKEGISIADSGKTNARRVADRLGDRFGDSQPLDFFSLQLGLAELVENDLAKLLTTDADHVRGVVGNRLQIQEREAAFAGAFEVLSSVRSAIEGVHGEATRVELFGSVSALPQDPLELHRLGVRIRDQLLNEAFVLPPVRLPGFEPLQRDQLASGLKPPLDRLGQVLASLSLERKDADVTLRDKTEGIEAFRRTVRFAAGCLASLYGLAGFDDLAAKIRPKRRAPRRPNGGGPDSDGGEETVSGVGSGDVETRSISEPSGEDGKEPVSTPIAGEHPGHTRSGPLGIVR